MNIIAKKYMEIQLFPWLDEKTTLTLRQYNIADFLMQINMLTTRQYNSADLLCVWVQTDVVVSHIQI